MYDEFGTRQHECNEQLDRYWKHVCSQATQDSPCRYACGCRVTCVPSYRIVIQSPECKLPVDDHHRVLCIDSAINYEAEYRQLRSQSISALQTAYAAVQQEEKVQFSCIDQQDVDQQRASVPHDVPAEHVDCVARLLCYFSRYGPPVTRCYEASGYEETAFNVAQSVVRNAPKARATIDPIADRVNYFCENSVAFANDPHIKLLLDGVRDMLRPHNYCEICPTQRKNRDLGYTCFYLCGHGSYEQHSDCYTCTLHYDEHGVLIKKYDYQQSKCKQCKNDIYPCIGVLLQNESRKQTFNRMIAQKTLLSAHYAADKESDNAQGLVNSVGGMIEALCKPLRRVGRIGTYVSDAPLSPVETVMHCYIDMYGEPLSLQFLHRLNMQIPNTEDYAAILKKIYKEKSNDRPSLIETESLNTRLVSATGGRVNTSIANIAHQHIVDFIKNLGRILLVKRNEIKQICGGDVKCRCAWDMYPIETFGS